MAACSVIYKQCYLLTQLIHRSYLVPSYFNTNISLPLNIVPVRYASKKTGTSTQNRGNRRRPKHRGWKVQDGTYVQAGNILVTQRTLRFHPGLNVGFGRNATLYALEPGRVIVTCEKVDLNWDHTWVQRNHEGRNEPFHKKYFNVITEPLEGRFKLIDNV